MPTWLIVLLVVVGYPVVLVLLGIAVGKLIKGMGR